MQCMHVYIEIIIMLFFFQDTNLDKVLDGNSKSGLHLGRIADAMTGWRGKIAEHLDLSPADVNVIETAHPGKLDLQKYVTIIIM